MSRRRQYLTSSRPVSKIRMKHPQAQLLAIKHLPGKAEAVHPPLGQSGRRQATEIQADLRMGLGRAQLTVS